MGKIKFTMRVSPVKRRIRISLPTKIIDDKRNYSRKKEKEKLRREFGIKI